jgi:hypothetical protein
MLFEIIFFLPSPEWDLAGMNSGGLLALIEKMD